MAHPHSAHRQHHVEKQRVAHITRGYAKGGAVHSDAKQDRKLVKSMIDKALHAEGGKSKHRMDKPHRAKGGRVKRADGGSAYVPSQKQQSEDAARKTREILEQRGVVTPSRAKGGRVKGKNTARTIVNVITGGHPAAGAVPPGPPPVAPPPMGVAPAAPPPMAAKSPMMPPPGAGGPPMPMRAKGGRVNQGSPVWEEGKRNGTQVQHSDGKATANKNLGRGKPITYNKGGKVCRATGGRIESPNGVAKATGLPGGSGGGEARLAKARREARAH